ncbi:MAG: hypothetical protein ABIJ34_05065 [archaeon]
MKKKKWTTTKLMAIGAIAVLEILIGLLGAGITITTGFVAAGGFINALTGAFMIVFTILVIQTFGAGTIKSLILGIIVLPLPLIVTPGFLPKVLIAFICGLVADITYYVLRKKQKLAVFFTGSLTQLCMALGIFYFGHLFKIPGMEFMSKLLFSPLALVYIVLTGLVGLFALKIYEKIKNTSVIKRIQK